MRRVIWVPIIICVLVMVLAGAAVVYGRTLQPPALSEFPAAGLGTCAGKWCLLQITPGLTTWREAKQVLATYITRDEGDHFHGQKEALDIRVEKGWTGSGISRIDIQSSRNRPDSMSLRFGQLIEQFGLPCFVVDVSPRTIGLVV